MENMIFEVHYGMKRNSARVVRELYAVYAIFIQLFKLEIRRVI
jgi:hypothetical protein